MSDYPNDEREGPRREPIISDMRHARDVDDVQAEDESLELIEAPETGAAEPEPEPVDEVVEEQPIEEPPADRSGFETVEAPEEEEQAQIPDEMAQLRQLFGAGIATYLRGQLGLLLNFALIYLGRAANPATSLVGVEPEKAKLAIDAIEFIYEKTRDEMAEQEQAEVEGILTELKYTFMQAAAGAPPPSPPEGHA